jgi:formate--tetrahydrofolate ligase
LFGVPIVIAINRKKVDTQQDITEICAQCSNFGVPVSISNVWAKGGKGGRELAQQVINLANNKTKLKFIYDLNASIQEKINSIATKIYGADGVDYMDQALVDIANLEKIGLASLPVCIAKTQYSLSDNASLFGRPKNFKITIRELKASAGAGFIVAYAGSILTMPGLPKHPAAENMDISENGKITGLF